MGTAGLLAAVVGSGIMGERLAGGNVAIALLASTMATGTILVVLISIFGPLSGAHFNPAVTLFFALRREIAPRLAAGYVAVQLVGAVCGVLIAHMMFAAPLFEISTRLRDGPAQALSEFVATFGLIGTIAGGVRYRPTWAPALVGLYISAAYWFTASTSFANPAVTLARALSNSFAGIAPHSVPGFLVAQLLGAIFGFLFFGRLFEAMAATVNLQETPERSDSDVGAVPN